MDRKKTIQVFEDMKRGLYPMYPDEYLDAAIESLSAEPCEDAISREEVLKAFVELPHEYKTTEQRARTGGIAACQAIVSDLPSVTPKQKMGRWIWKGGYHGIPYCHCSECGNGQWEMSWSYCPFCGVKMEESK